MSCVEHFGYYDGVEDFPEHRHTSCELLYLHEGETSIICGEKEFEIKSGISNQLLLQPFKRKYRLKNVFTVYAGSKYETVTKYSSEKTV